MDRDQLLQKLTTAAAKNAERASDCANPDAMTPESATSAAKYAGAALQLTQATVTLQAGSNGRRG